MAQFVKLLTACQSRIYAYILSRAPRSADADDILQETAGTMWKKFNEFKTGTDFLAWGLTIARYNVLNYRKNTKKTAPVAGRGCYQPNRITAGRPFQSRPSNRCIEKMH